MSEPLIKMRGICRDFAMGDQVVHALARVDLDIAAGEVIVLVGASGSGKSTLLNIIGCLDRPTAGSYALDGREVATASDRERVGIRRNQIGFVFRTFQLVPRMTAERNVELPMMFAGVAPGERRARAERSLDAVGLSHRLRHRPAELSGGERQRVAIARALAMSPPILLADEPTGNLDSVAGQEIIRLLSRLNQEGKTIVVVTHNAELEKLGHRVLRMRDGSFA